jgi:hypothetical protein
MTDADFRLSMRSIPTGPPLQGSQEPLKQGHNGLDERKLPSRDCDKCGAEMTHLSDWPSYQGAVPMRIFRCYACNNVVSEDLP